MIFGCYFTRYKQLEFWEEMENRIHVRQYIGILFACIVISSRSIAMSEAIIIKMG